MIEKIGSVVVNQFRQDDRDKLINGLSKIYSLPRFYCGPSVFTAHLNVIIEYHDRTLERSLNDILNNIIKIVNETNQKYTLRESVLCIAKKGQHGKEFKNTNWLDYIAKRIHVILGPSNGGRFIVKNDQFKEIFEYNIGDVILIDEPDKTIIHEYNDQRFFHMVCLFTPIELDHKKSWELFHESITKAN